MASRIHHIVDARSAVNAGRLPRGARVTVGAPGIDGTALADIEKTINSALGACGCRQSAQLLVAAVGLCLVFDLHHCMRAQPVHTTDLLLQAVIAFLASGAGRAAGILMARRRLRRTLGALIAHFRDGDGNREFRSLSQGDFHGMHQRLQPDQQQL